MLAADDPAWTDLDAPWFDGDWLTAQVAADLEGTTIAADPDEA